MEDIKKVIIFGFIFGMFFSFIVYIAQIEMSPIFLLMIPFLVAILCGLGAIVAIFVNSLLIAKGSTNPLVNQGIGFLCAATVNGLLVYSTYAYFTGGSLNKELILGSILGIGIGGIYGIYRFRIDRLNEKMKFLEELSDKNRQIQEAARKLAITEERNRMGRELHDSVSQGLHGLVFSFHSLRNELKEPPERVAEILNYMEATANSTLDELRTMIEELKPSLLADEGLKEAITVTANLFSQRKGIPVELEIDLPHQLTPSLEMTIYRITQEGLANIEKHTDSKHVYLKLGNNGGTILLTISDDGQGFIRRKTPSGHGLENIRQRVEEEGGVLDIISKPGIGTTIFAKFPPKG